MVAQGDMKPKLRPIENQAGRFMGYMFFCPGCRRAHFFRTNDPRRGRNWTFNGNVEEPTFSPSLLTQFPGGTRCRLYLTRGKIQFLSDCTHPMAGRTVDMVDFEDEDEDEDEERGER
jgi:hypothetical protein